MRIVMTVLLALVLASPVAAQERYKDVWVTHSDSGDIVRGRIAELSGDSIAILTSDNRRIDMPLARVLRIEAQGDSVKNGAAIGAAVMGGLAALGCLVTYGGGECATVTVFNTAFGGLAGAGIDALNGGRTPLYSRPAAAPQGTTGRVQFRLRF